MTNYDDIISFKNGYGSLTFVKWAGGKTQLIDQLSDLLPKKIERYFEPFIGGGALFFYVMQKYRPKYAYISDTNEDLIITYQVIRDSVEELIKELKKHKEEHKKDWKKFGDEKDRRIKELNKLKKKISDKDEFEKVDSDLKILKKEKRDELPKRYYYRARKYFNENKKSLTKVEIASYFIYFNKTCFNGIYRVNPKGEFNVPMGDASDFIIDENRLRNASYLLNKNVEISVGDYKDIEDKVQKGDFVYFDPPYYPLSETAKFTSYTKNNFLEKEQQELSNFFRKLDKKKECLLMLSNSDTNFIHNLYKDYNLKFVNARRAINCVGEKRGVINEVVVMNY